MSSARRRRIRQTLQPTIITGDKPRAECAYDEIYPSLNVKIPLVIDFTCSSIEIQGESGHNGIDGTPKASHSSSQSPPHTGRAIRKRRRRTQKEIWGSQATVNNIISRRTRLNSGLGESREEAEEDIGNGISGGHINVNDNNYNRRVRITRSSNEASSLRRSTRTSDIPNYREPISYDLEDEDEAVGANGENNAEVNNKPDGEPDDEYNDGINGIITNSGNDKRSDRNTSTNNTSITPTTTTNSSYRIIQRPEIIKLTDKSLISAGYAQSDSFTIPDSYIRTFVTIDQSTVDENETDNKPQLPLNPVEYDMDEQDEHFLNLLNRKRQNHIIKKRPLPPISREIFEITMTLIEIEWFKIEKLMPAKKKNIVEKDIIPLPTDADSSIPTSINHPDVDEKCIICDDSECDNSNAIVFCDGCDIAVHQDCYGVPFIPEGQWLCRQCSVSRRLRANCIFCPNKSGAFKQTDTQHWAHVLCSLWIPETSIANLSYMEPIIGLKDIPKGRWKLNCSICKQKYGACIQCVNKNCFQAFHPTCARRAKLYMKMETGILGAIHDPTSMVVYCEKHSPSSYNESIDLQSHIKATQQYYRELREKAVSVPKSKDIITSSTSTTPWRTEEGTPIIPNIIVKKISSIMNNKFSIVEYVDHFLLEVCRYWALKRRLKRGAALIKRLQIALEVQPKRKSNELSIEELREDIKEKKLLLQALEIFKEQSNNILQRETMKLSKTNIQDEIINRVYFPEIQIINDIWKEVNDKIKVPDSIDTSTIQQKITNQQFKSVLEFSIAIEEYFSNSKPPITAPRWLKTRFNKALNVCSSLSVIGEESEHPILSNFDIDGTDIKEKEWIGSRIRREMSPMTDLDDSELERLEQQSLENHSVRPKKRPKKRRR